MDGAVQLCDGAVQCRSGLVFTGYVFGRPPVYGLCAPSEPDLRRCISCTLLPSAHGDERAPGTYCDWTRAAGLCVHYEWAPAQITVSERENKKHPMDCIFPCRDGGCGGLRPEI